MKQDEGYRYKNIPKSIEVTIGFVKGSKQHLVSSAKLPMFPQQVLV